MGRKNQIKRLYVYMNSKLVGELERASTGQLTFTYDEQWLSQANALPISLSMPLTEVPYKGSVVENYFDNLLPDSKAIRERIQARFAAPSEKCFDLLSQTGQDCVGALQLLTSSDVNNKHEITASPISDKDIETLLKNYQTAPLGMDREHDFRISIAGAQEKTALLWYKNQWHIPSGITPTSHIIKLPIGKIKHWNADLTLSVENEWLCLKILAAYGLPVNQASIVKFGNLQTLVVERFDRQWSDDGKWLMRLSQDDCCQVFGASGGNKYENDGGPGIKEIMEILSGSTNAIDDRRRFMKSVFLFWVMGAIDGHAKNFSVSIGEKGRYHLAPLYDVMSAYPLLDNKQLQLKDMKMAMAARGKNAHYKWNEIQLRHWLETANKSKFSENIMKEIIHEVFDNMDAVIDQVKKELPDNFPADISEPIFAGMKRVRDRAVEKS